MQMSGARRSLSTEQSRLRWSPAAVRSTTFIEIALTDDDRPIAGHAFELVLPDGRTVWPKTSRNGTVRIDSVAEGTCDCTISEIDNDFWRRTK